MDLSIYPEFIFHDDNDLVTLKLKMRDFKKMQKIVQTYYKKLEYNKRLYHTRKEKGTLKHKVKLESNIKLEYPDGLKMIAELVYD